MTNQLIQDDIYWMQQALLLAQAAEDLGEVPVGALVVQAGRVLGSGFNQVIHRSDPSAHAEILALRGAGAAINNHRLMDTTLYVTLEPCTMCVGAIVHSRISRLVFGAAEPKAGAVYSQSALLDAAYMNWRVAYQGGVCEQACSQLLTDFFARRRTEIAQARQ